MRTSECEEITISYVSGVEKACCIELFGVKQRDVVRPEGMSRKSPERRKQFRDSCGRARRIWIAGMANDSQNAIFRQRARRPCSMTLFGKPRMSAVMLHVSRIDQRDQDVHVQQKPGQSSSSRRLCTSSDVTRGAPLRTFSSGTPFLVLAEDSTGNSARLASEEMTSPTVLFSMTAISLAALKISSSMTSVVRIKVCPHYASCIIHQMYC